MDRYGTIAYRTEDGSFTEAKPIRQQDREPDLTFFARYLAEKLKNELKEDKKP